MPRAGIVTEGVVEGEENELQDAVGIDVAAEMHSRFARAQEPERDGEREELHEVRVESRFVGPDRECKELSQKENREINPIDFRENTNLRFYFNQKIIHFTFHICTFTSFKSQMLGSAMSKQAWPRHSPYAFVTLHI